MILYNTTGISHLKGTYSIKITDFTWFRNTQHYLINTSQSQGIQDVVHKPNKAQRPRGAACPRFLSRNLLNYLANTCK